MSELKYANSVIKDICTRRSCRKFKDQAISNDDLAQIMAAALHAPSAMNKQAWTFTVINNREIIRKLAGVMAKALDNPKYDMYDPQVLIIPSIPKDIVYGIDDVACALENIFLAAHSLGIGSCWINQMRRVLDDADVKSMLKELGIPEENTIYDMAILGYPETTEVAPIERTGKVYFIK